jgi:hypothetical protein
MSFLINPVKEATIFLFINQTDIVLLQNIS